jgi:hypothetical protein
LLHSAFRPLPTPRTALAEALRVDRSLTLIGLAMGLLLIVTLVGLVLDPRVISGVLAWLKPSKFAASFALYLVTFLWLLHFVQGRRWLVRVAATVTAVVSAVEVAIIGLHALQAIPLLGWLITRRARGLSPQHQVALVGLGALAYLGLVLLLTWQALRGQPITRPDVMTLGALLALTGTTIVIASAIVAHGQRVPKARREIPHLGS